MWQPAAAATVRRPTYRRQQTGKQMQIQIQLRRHQIQIQCGALYMYLYLYMYLCLYMYLYLYLFLYLYLHLLLHLYLQLTWPVWGACMTIRCKWVEAHGAASGGSCCPTPLKRWRRHLPGGSLAWPGLVWHPARPKIAERTNIFHVYFNCIWRRSDAYSGARKRCGRGRARERRRVVRAANAEVLINCVRKGEGEKEAKQTHWKCKWKLWKMPSEVGKIVSSGALLEKSSLKISCTNLWLKLGHNLRAAQRGACQKGRGEKGEGSVCQVNEDAVA